MSDHVSTWLPVDIATRDDVQGVIAAALSDWSAQWFVRSRTLVTGFWPSRDAGETCARAAWSTPYAAVAVSCPAAARARLAGWALDKDLERAPLRRADRRLLTVFGRTLVEDLARRVELALGLSVAPGGPPQPAFGSLGAAVAAVSDDAGQELLRLAAPLEALLPLCRAALPPPPAPGRMGKVVQALSGADLTIEARLGVADITVGDLRGLAPGDILMLEQGLMEAVEVFLVGSESKVARGKMLDLGGQIALALET